MLPSLFVQYTESGFAPLIKLEGPTSPVQCMTTVEGGESSAGLLISAHRGGTVHMWDLTSGAPTTGSIDGERSKRPSMLSPYVNVSMLQCLQLGLTECLPSANPPPSAINTGHTNALCAIWLEESYLFTAALDGHVKVWDGNVCGASPLPSCAGLSDMCGLRPKTMRASPNAGMSMVD